MHDRNSLFPVAFDLRGVIPIAMHSSGHYDYSVLFNIDYTFQTIPVSTVPFDQAQKKSLICSIYKGKKGIPHQAIPFDQ